MTELRKITSYTVDGALRIVSKDDPGPGGAHHAYVIAWGKGELPITFQFGHTLESGHNGVTDEALLAVIVDRLRSFQAGPLACRENEIALTKIEEALHWLHHRTRDRLARGVKGTGRA
ncbi:hypothetical protein [Microbaculum sp. FT89]|uniref:hypothetical protein n=1 Tax=Microbaculum sp. FT89 TaxID=3447298 RepID=UPI003F533C5F